MSIIKSLFFVSINIILSSCKTPEIITGIEPHTNIFEVSKLRNNINGRVKVISLKFKLNPVSVIYSVNLLLKTSSIISVSNQNQIFPSSRYLGNLRKFVKNY